MPVVALVSRKGGVGKTSLCIALTDYLSSVHEARVLVIDVDPQANSTLAFMDDQQWAAMDLRKRTIADLFQALMRNEDVPSALVWTGASRVRNNRGLVHVIPGSPRLQAMEEAILEGDKEWRHYQGSPYLVLHNGLRDVVHAYDYVLIDCPPSLGLVTMNGISLAHGYLMPTIADNLSTAGLPQMVRKVQEHAAAFRRPIKRLGTVVTRYKTLSNLHAIVLDRLRSSPEISPVWDTIVPDTVKAEEGWDEIGPLTLVQRYGRLHATYETLAREFRRRVG